MKKLLIIVTRDQETGYYDVDTYSLEGWQTHFTELLKKKLAQTRQKYKDLKNFNNTQEDLSPVLIHLNEAQLHMLRFKLKELKEDLVNVGECPTLERAAILSHSILNNNNWLDPIVKKCKILNLEDVDNETETH